MPRSSASVRAWGLISWAAKTPWTGASSGSRFSSDKISGKLLDSVDLAAALDLDRDGDARRVAGQDVDRPDRRRVLAAHQAVALAEGVDLLGQQLLQVRLDAVLDQAGVDAELVRGVVQHLLDA